MSKTDTNRETNDATGPGSRASSKAPKFRTPIIVVTVLIVVGLALVAVAPPLYTMIMGAGVKTEGVNSDNAIAASTDLNGDWSVVPGQIPNTSSAGFTFAEILPGERKITSGSTFDIEGGVEVRDETLTAATITVDMSNIGTDQEKRDINVRMKLLHTDKFPTAQFVVTTHVDLSAVPDDGTVAQVVIPGALTVHGVTKDVSPTFDVLRTGDQIIVAGDIEINRLDYGVETPDFVAAKVDEIGEINVRVALEK